MCFALLKAYRQDPRGFTIAHQRSTRARLSVEVEGKIESALLREEAIVENPDLPISSYNYTTMRDRLEGRGVQVSMTTIISTFELCGCPLFNSS